MARAVVYLRVSTDNQKLSPEAQEHACRAWATAHKFDVVGPFSERKGVSGATPLDNRPGLIAAIGQLGKGDVLLIAKRDRIARDKVVIATAEAVVKGKGARLVSAAGEGTDGDEPADALTTMIIDAFAVFERLQIKARTKAALSAKRRRGERSGGIPYGWEEDPSSARHAKSGKLLGVRENAEEQRWLAMMVELHAAGVSNRQIARRFTETGVPTKAGRGRWHSNTVNQILKRYAVRAEAEAEAEKAEGLL